MKVKAFLLMVTSLLLCPVLALGSSAATTEAALPVGEAVAVDNTAARKAFGQLGITVPDEALEDGVMSRAEAFTAVVRMLGAENDALTGSYRHPFTDVPAEFDKYIAYCYEKHLTYGISDTLFDPDSEMTAAQFLTVMLRAAGYSDTAGEFVWDKPYALAVTVGLVDTETPIVPFTVGNAVAVFWRALAAEKNGVTLAATLAARGVFKEKVYEYAVRIAGGERLRVVCVGDSITEGYNASDRSKYSYPSQMANIIGSGYTVINCGKSASYALSLDSVYNVKKSDPTLYYKNTEQYKKLMTSEADIVIVMLGTNDARSMTVPKAVEDWKESYKSLLADIASLDTHPDIYLSTMIPAVNAFQTYDGTVYTVPQAIREVGAELGYPVIETGEILGDYFRVDLKYNDSVHPNDTSYGQLARHFAREVFGADVDLIELPKAKENVVYVSSRGKRTNDGATPETPVDKVCTAIAMLRENGGTVVVCGTADLGVDFTVPCNGNVTITSVYGGVDYRETANAKLRFTGGAMQLGSDLTIENVDFVATVSASRIHCCYHNFTVGEGVVWSGEKSGMTAPSINAGYSPAAAGMGAENFVFHGTCNITVCSGSWSLIRGGDFLSAKNTVCSTIAADATLNITIHGGSFSHGCSVTGMSNTLGTVNFTMDGGSMPAGLTVIAPPNNNTVTLTCSGTVNTVISGGKIGGIIRMSAGGYTPVPSGSVTLTYAKSAVTTVTETGFTSVTAQ